MDKLKYIKLENEDGSYSSSIPLAVDSDYVNVNGNTLTNELMNKATKTEVQALASGSPFVANSITEMTDTTKIYVNTSDGYWYYYNNLNWEKGGIYQSTGLGYLQIKENNVDNKSIVPYKIIDGIVGPNIYNKNLDTDGGYINPEGEIGLATNNIYTPYIYCNEKNNLYISVVRYLNLPFSVTIAEYDDNFNFIIRHQISLASDMTYDSENDIYYLNILLNENTKYIRMSYYYSSNYDKYINKVMLNLENRNTNYIDYYWYIDNLTHKNLSSLIDKVNNIENWISNTHLFDKSNYKLHYIKDKKVTCNKISENLTAVYAGVDLGEKVNRMECKYIWENKENVNYSGTLALIFTPNGANKITDITNLSLHITFRNYGFTCDVFGRRYNPSQNRYQNIMQVTYNTPQEMDGTTEHTIQIRVSMSLNTVYITVDGIEYSGTFSPDENISSLNDVIGNYVIFEHYTDTNLEKANMPLITKMKIQNISEAIKLLDYFDREDGQLNVAPTGQTYHLFNNGIYNI